MFQLTCWLSWSCIIKPGGPNRPESTWVSKIISWLCSEDLMVSNSLRRLVAMVNRVRLLILKQYQLKLTLIMFFGTVAALVRYSTGPEYWIMHSYNFRMQLKSNLKCLKYHASNLIVLRNVRQVPSVQGCLITFPLLDSFYTTCVFNYITTAFIISWKLKHLQLENSLEVWLNCSDQHITIAMHVHGVSSTPFHDLKSLFKLLRHWGNKCFIRYTTSETLNEFKLRNHR